MLKVKCLQDYHETVIDEINGHWNEVLLFKAGQVYEADILVAETLDDFIRIYREDGAGVAMGNIGDRHFNDYFMVVEAAGVHMQ